MYVIFCLLKLYTFLAASSLWVPSIGDRGGDAILSIFCKSCLESIPSQTTVLFHNTFVQSHRLKVVVRGRLPGSKPSGAERQSRSANRLSFDEATIADDIKSIKCLKTKITKRHHSNFSNSRRPAHKDEENEDAEVHDAADAGGSGAGSGTIGVRDVRYKDSPRDRHGSSTQQSRKKSWENGRTESTRDGGNKGKEDESAWKTYLRSLSAPGKQIIIL